MSDVDDNSMPGAHNSSSTQISSEPSGICDIELTMAQTMGINIEAQQNCTHFGDDDRQTPQIRGNTDVDQIQLNHTQNGKAHSSYAAMRILTTIKGANLTSTINSEAGAIPLVTFDPDPYLQGHFDYFDAQRYVLGPPDIMPFDAEPCAQLNVPMADFDSPSA